MEKRKKIILGVVTILALTSPALFLLRVIEASVAFPIMFIMIGVQNITLSLVYRSTNGKKSTKGQFIVGVVCIIFGLGIVLPYYIFFQ